MTPTCPDVSRSLLLTALILAMALGWGSALQGQALTLKREIPGAEPYSCPPMDPPPPPGDEERTEGVRLASDANQAQILGDRVRARDLLARATQLDPTSPELAYRYARVLEELGATEEALSQYCRVLFLGPEAEGVEDVSERVQGVVERERAEIPDEAIGSFQVGIIQADEGRLEASLESFAAAWRAAPDWADAVYDRGIIQARLGRGPAAIEDFESYLRLRPDAEDAILVSQQIGRLRAVADLPSPSAALTLGILFPGAGQFYSGRAWGGLAVLGLTAGSAAAGFLIEEVTVMCVGSVPPGGECPPDRVIGENTDTPYLVPGLAAAGAVAILGAVEAFFNARGRRTREVGAVVALGGGDVRLRGPSLTARGTRLDVNLMRLTF